MPQSLIRTDADAGQPLRHGGALLISSHESIVALLRSRLGSNQAELFAKPRVGPDGSISWSTGLAGPVLRGSELADAERADLQRRCDRFVSNIQALAKTLNNEGPDGVVWCRLLERAVIRPAGDWLFSVDDRPVLVMWAHVGPSDAIPLDPAAPVAAPTPAYSPSAAVPAQAPSPSAVAKASAPAAPIAGETQSVSAPLPRAEITAIRDVRLRWLPAAVAVLGLVTLALVGFAAWRLAAEGLLPGVDSLDDRIAAAELRNAELQSRLQARSGNGQECRPDDPLPRTGQGAATSQSSVPIRPAASSPTEAASQDGTGAPAAATRSTPAPAPPAMPQMPSLPKIPELPGTAPSPRSLLLPSTSLQTAPSGAESPMTGECQPGQPSRTRA